MRITEPYAALNRQLHDASEHYGTSGRNYAPHVEELATLLNTTSILDYGCGKGLLAKSIPSFKIREYDPCVRGKDAEPEPAGIVVCTDVMEHVEPECVQDVLDHLRALARKLVMFSIYIGPANKRLPDGRNVHLSDNPSSWWIAELNRRWTIVQLEYQQPLLFALCETGQRKIEDQVLWT